ncbi:MAG: hypothetical protein QG653_367 [Patescibacteria group bacterium]|nr:hypothetical protein [Patescibacteria group bacterium]
MESNFKPAIVLVIIATVLPEILTGSSSLSAFFNPVILLILFLGYGVAVLVVREIAVRYNVTFGGIFMLGFAFSLFNEGLVAKTLIRFNELPVGQYDNYGYLLGISFPFTFAIGFWHALSSVLMPILLTYWLYPKHKNQPWLSKKMVAIFGVVLLFLASAMFLGEEGIRNTLQQNTLLQLAIFLGMMFVSFLIAKRLIQVPTTTNETPVVLTLKPVWLGMSLFFPFFLVLSFITDKKLSLVIFFIALFLIVWGYYKILKRKGWLTQNGLILFGIGSYIQNTVMGMIAALTIPSTLVERILTGVIAILLLLWLARRVKKSNNLDNVSVSST